MPRRPVLSKAQRQSFQALPNDPEELIRYYTLGEEDLALARRHRTGSNRLGFAVQLCLVRYPGRAWRSGEAVPRALIEFVGEQLGTPLLR
jgi:TnpA family transposase